MGLLKKLLARNVKDAIQGAGFVAALECFKADCNNLQAFHALL